MKFYFSSFFFLLFSPLIVFSQSWAWGKSFKATPPKNVNVSLACDTNGNVYLHGRIINFGPDSSHYADYTDESVASLYIVKYNSNGKLIWKKYSELTKDVYEESANLVSDVSGNLYISGIFQDSITFDSVKLMGKKTYPFPSEKFEYLKTWNNGFVFKFNSAGKILWAKKIWGDSLDGSILGTIDNNGNFYLAGAFSGRLVLNERDTIRSDKFVFFVAKFDQEGRFIWSEKPASLSNGCGMGCAGIISDSKGNIYLTGSFNSAISIGQFKINAPVKDMYIVKFDPSGNVIWVRQSTSLKKITNYHPNVFGITKDKFDNIYITGSCGDSVKFWENVISNKNQHAKPFLVKYNQDGIACWAIESGSVKDRNSWCGYSVFADDSDRVYICGGIHNWQYVSNDTTNIYIDSSNKISSIFSNGEAFSFFEQYNAANGKLQYANILPGGDAEITNITGTHSAKYIYTGGILRTQLDFGNDTIEGSYVARYKPYKNTLKSYAPLVKVNCGDITVDNVFTPPYQFIWGYCLKTFDLVINDKWGKKLFECDNINLYWDGKFNGMPQAAGLYSYIIKAVLEDGTIINKTGQFELKR
jgi:hypothetical protein